MTEGQTKDELQKSGLKKNIFEIKKIKFRAYICYPVSAKLTVSKCTPTVTFQAKNATTIIQIRMEILELSLNYSTD